MYQPRGTTMALGLPIVSVFVTLLFAAGKTQGAVGPNQLQREVPDVSKIFADFVHPIGARDTNRDELLQCLSAQRTHYDSESSNATYVWSLNKDGGKKRVRVSLHHTLGDTPGTTYYTVGPSTDVEVGRFHYTDYKNCAVLEMHHFGDQCTLWVTKDVLDSIPEECLKQYNDICGSDSVSLYSKNKCKNAGI
ncbi:uncharacterized protein LOC144151994 [Haemaphysalis longicornis]